VAVQSQELAGARALLRPEVRLRPWRVLSRVPGPIWLVTILFALLLGSWSVLVPQYHAPDEPHHVDAVLRLAEGKGWPPVGHATISPETVGSLAAAPVGTRAQPYLLAVGPFTKADAIPRGDRPRWRELPKPGQPAPDVQQMMQHPPLYYLVGAGLLKALPGAPQDLRFDLVIGLLRLMSVLMVAPLPLLAWACADRLTESRAAGRVAALVPLGIPMLTHIGASVNNDALLVLTGSLATLAICYVLRGDTSLRTGLWTGAFIGLAMFSKSLGVVFVPLAIAAYLLAWRRGRRALARDQELAPDPGSGRSAATARTDVPFLLADAVTDPAVPTRAARLPWAPVLLGALAALATGAWWFVVNLVRYHSFQPSTPGFVPGTKLSGWSEFTDMLVNGTILRWWGDFGWFEVNLPELAARIGTAAVAVLVAVALVQARRPDRRIDLLCMLWPTVGLFALMTLQAALHFHRTYYVSGISGRYLFAGLASLAVVVGAGAASLGRFTRFAPPLVLAAAVAMQALAVHAVFPRWWEGPKGTARTGLDGMLAWSPWPAVAVEVVLGLTAAGLVATAVWAIVFAVRPDPRDPGERDAPAGVPLGDLIAGHAGSPNDFEGFGTDRPAGAGTTLPGDAAQGNGSAPTPGARPTAAPNGQLPHRQPGAHRHRRG
jgi:small subunit ribosomal protein S36